MKPARLATTVALLAGLASAAPLRPAPEPVQPTDPSVRTLRVEGQGEAKAEPDEGWIDLAVESRASTAKAAGEANARKMESVISALTAAGVPRQELDTRDYTVLPEYSQPEPQTQPRLRGYVASNTLSVHVRELPRMGTLIDQALAAGANRVNGVRFGLCKEEAVRAEALRQAVDRAHGTAEVLASSLGARLGPVLDASTVTQPPQIHAARMPMSMAERSGAPPTPILPEEQTLTARVTLVYLLEGGR